MSIKPDKSNSEKVDGDKTTTGNIKEGIGIAIGTGASVEIHGDIHYCPIKLHANRRHIFKPLLESHTDLFAGRDAAFSQIAEFIKQPCGGYLVVSAPDGFGKTALMVNLVNKTPEAFAYHFFDPETNPNTVTEVGFLENVVEQMAQWHGHNNEELPDELSDLQALYYKFLDEKLEHKQILVLDGLNKVTTWKLRPYLTDLPENLYVILTLCDIEDCFQVYELPVNKLQHLKLEKLTSDDVKKILCKAGENIRAFAENPILNKVAIFGDLFRDYPDGIRKFVQDAAIGNVTSVNLDKYLEELRKEYELSQQESEVPVDTFAAIHEAIVDTNTIRLNYISLFFWNPMNWFMGLVRLELTINNGETTISKQVHLGKHRLKTQFLCKGLNKHREANILVHIKLLRVIYELRIDNEEYPLIKCC